MTTTETPASVANMPRIGDPAPAFTAQTTQGELNFPADYAGKCAKEIPAQEVEAAIGGA